MTVQILVVGNKSAQFSRERVLVELMEIGTFAIYKQLKGEKQNFSENF